jgi:hypothetical protein
MNEDYLAELAKARTQMSKELSALNAPKVRTMNDPNLSELEKARALLTHIDEHGERERQLVGEQLKVDLAYAAAVTAAAEQRRRSARLAAVSPATALFKWAWRDRK